MSEHRVGDDHGASAPVGLLALQRLLDGGLIDPALPSLDLDRDQPPVSSSDEISAAAVVPRYMDAFIAVFGEGHRDKVIEGDRVHVMDVIAGVLGAPHVWVRRFPKGDGHNELRMLRLSSPSIGPAGNDPVAAVCTAANHVER
jgi:hypothetical protein